MSQNLVEFCSVISIPLRSLAIKRQTALTRLGKNYGPILSRFGIRVHEILKDCREALVVPSARHDCL